MSKFFDETRKAQDWDLREGAAANLDVHRVLEGVNETMREAESVAKEVGDTRLASCRKIHLVRTPDSLLIPLGDDAADTAADCYRALRTRLMRAQSVSGLRSIVISSALKGEGKTLTAMNLGLACARLQGARVLVIDSDLRSRGLTRMLGYPAAPGLAEVLGKQAEFQDVILSTDLPSLYVVGAGTPSAAPSELYVGDRWKEFIGWCSESFKLILVDSPPIVPLTDFELISAGCDSILIVVRALRTRREFLRKVADQVDKQKLLGAVLNAASLDGTGAYYYYYRYGHGKNGQG